MRTSAILSVVALALAQLAAAHPGHPARASGSAEVQERLSFEPTVPARRYSGENSLPASFIRQDAADNRNGIDGKNRIKLENIDFSATAKAAEQIALQFFPAANGFEWIVKSAYTTQHNFVSHVYLRQTFNGREIVNADANINIDLYGNVLSAAENGVTAAIASAFSSSFSGPLEFQMAPTDALKQFARHLKMSDLTDVAIKSSLTGDNVIVAPEISLDDVPFKEAYIQVNGQAVLRPVWNMVVRQDNAWYDVAVDAISGQVHSMIDWVADNNNVLYEVFKEPKLDFRYGNRTVLLNPFIKSSSPDGWNTLMKFEDGQEYITTIGNNVIAQENVNNVVTGWEKNYRPKVNASIHNGVFRPFDLRFPIDVTQDPSTYQDASITNLFYWNNFLHDLYYLYGFNEQSGNFQENNFARGGLGGDAVQANAQDGSGNNNANFATPPDGQRPRMRMYIYTRSDPYRDGALDSGIVIHEYSHGLSNRLTGGPANSNCLGVGQAGGMGEGWGDCIGAFLESKKGDDPNRILYHAAYASNKEIGNRKYGYTANTTANPHTFASLNLDGNSEVHAAGNIWCSILWEPFVKMVQKHGFGDWRDERKQAGNHKMLQNVIDGMKLQPCRPSFVDARDSIILADRINYGGENECLLWHAFAKRGLGLSADAIEPVVEAFDVPARCQRSRE